MLLNDDIVDTEKPGGICSLTLLIDDISGLFVDPSIVSDIHSRSVEIINGAFSDSHID